MPVLLQALVEDPPVHPVDVLREIIDLGQLPLQPAYEAGDPQEGFTSSETDDSLDATELDQDLLAEGSSQLQNVEQAMDASQPIQPARGNATEAAGWTDDSFTDAAIDDSDFDAGFDIVEQNQYL